jgi:hypothetical protein
MPDLSDDEIIAREKRKIRNAAISGLVGGLILVGLTILLWNVRPAWLDKYLLLVPAVAIVATLAAWHFFWRQAPEAISDRILRKRVDEFQGRNRLYLLGGTFLVGQTVLNAPATAQQLAPGGFPPRPIIVILLLLAAADFIAFGFGSLNRRFDIINNDELARALRFQVSRLGYLVLMAGLCAAYLAFLYRPDLLSLVLRGALFAGIAVPALCYIGLEWRAGRGG